MKKTLLLSLIGLMVTGSVFALPSVDDRKTSCQKQPTEYVWVEKNETCIPINPCESYVGSDLKKAYCIEREYKISEEAFDMGILDRYIKSVLNTTKTSCKKLMDSNKYIACHFSDGGYAVFYNVFWDIYTDPRYAAMWAACSAYNKGGYDYKDGFFICENTESKEDCTDMGEFASQLSGEKCTGYYMGLYSIGTVCNIMCGEEK